MRTNYKQLPDLDGLGFDWPELKALVAEHEKLTSEWREGQAAAREAVADLEAAKTKDTEARTEALRKSRKDPGKRHEEKASKEAERVRDYLQLREKAIEAVERDLSNTVLKHRSEWKGEAEKEAGRAAEEMRGALDTFRRTQQRYREVRGLIRWLENLGPACPPETPRGVRLPSRGGIEFSVDEALGVLDRSIAPVEGVPTEEAGDAA